MEGHNIAIMAQQISKISYLIGYDLDNERWSWRNWVNHTAQSINRIRVKGVFLLKKYLAGLAPFIGLLLRRSQTRWDTKKSYLTSGPNFGDKLNAPEYDYRVGAGARSSSALAWALWFYSSSVLWQVHTWQANSFLSLKPMGLLCPKFLKSAKTIFETRNFARLSVVERNRSVAGTQLHDNIECQREAGLG